MLRCQRGNRCMLSGSARKATASTSYMQRKYATVEWELQWAWQGQESGSTSLCMCVCVRVRHVCVAGLQLCALFFNLLRAHNKSLLLSFSSNCSSYDDAGCSSSTLAPVATPTTTVQLPTVQCSWGICQCDVPMCACREREN